jgi:hypothetical protein
MEAPACCAQYDDADGLPGRVVKGAFAGIGRHLERGIDRSSEVVRGKYDGKEIIVRGYIETPATMPKPGDDQGSVSLKEKGHQPGQQVTCWFSKDQTAEFSKIRGDQYITVKGVFNGEAGAELKFCKLIGTE